MKSRFLNPVAQADTLNKIILIPRGKRNENEEINMEWGGGEHPFFPPPSLTLTRLSFSLPDPWTPVASSIETVIFPLMLRVGEI